MSGGRYDYASNKMEEYFESHRKIRAAIQIIAWMMRDVEWVESGDSSWDTAMAAEWYSMVQGLCKMVYEDETEWKPGTAVPPHAPAHHPNGETHCQYCGSPERAWNKVLRTKEPGGSDDHARM